MLQNRAVETAKRLIMSELPCIYYCTPATDLPRAIIKRYNTESGKMINIVPSDIVCHDQHRLSFMLIYTEIFRILNDHGAFRDKYVEFERVEKIVKSFFEVER